MFAEPIQDETMQLAKAIFPEKLYHEIEEEKKKAQKARITTSQVLTTLREYGLDVGILKDKHRSNVWLQELRDNNRAPGPHQNNGGASVLFHCKKCYASGWESELVLSR
jgi:hypothetical protein